MIRDVTKLKNKNFDLLVVGGGIYGAWTACDAALRGLKTAIIDKGDWASGTSSASTKLIHGGLRYLENLKLNLVRTTLEERKLLAHVLPHMIVPVRFFMPVYTHSRVGPLKLRTGLMMYDFLAGKKQPVDPYHSVSCEKIKEDYPFLKVDDLTGGFVYGDCQTDDFRFTLAIVKAASQAGAVTANYVKAATDIIKTGQFQEIGIYDNETGKSFKIKARAIVSSTGPWEPVSDGRHSVSEYIRMSKGVHLIMPPLATEDALLLMTKKDNRIIFAVPWYGKTILGTTDADFEGNPEKVSVTKEDVDYLLREINRFFKKPIWNASSVIGKFAGLRTLKNEPGKPPSEVTREWSYVELQPGVYLSVGGKITSARIDAAKMVDRVVAFLGLQEAGHSKTENMVFQSKPAEDYENWYDMEMKKNAEAGMDKEMSNWSIFRHGTGVKKIRELIKTKPNLKQRIIADLPFSKADLIFSAGNEMTIHLDDLVRRRIPLSILSKLSKKDIKKIAKLAAKPAGWSFWRKRREIKKLFAS